MLEVRGLSKSFPVKAGLFSKTKAHIAAVRNVSFSLSPGQTLGIVGESGCGKTTLLRMITRLIEPSAGEILLQGRDLLKLKGTQLRSARKDFQLVFQDPSSSLNPRWTVQELLEEPLQVHKLFSNAKARQARVIDLLHKVGMNEQALHRFPREFSGGQRQRISLARALAVQPKLLILDEPVSALDVSVQAQILNLLLKLQREENLTMLLVSHDLNVIRHLCHQIAVMYLGEIVEAGPDVADSPQHPYTQALVASVPRLFSRSLLDGVTLKGEIPSPMNVPKGCSFQPRCPKAFDRCQNERPEFRNGKACFL